MSESTRTSRAPADKRLTYQQWKRRKMLRLARNWVLFLAGCAAVVALLTGGILWLLPKVHSLLAGPKVFAASVYNGADYVFNAADTRLTLVNANLPYTVEPTPLLDIADETTGQQLEAEAAMQYRSMAAAAQADGVSLPLVAGYQDADTRQDAYEARVQTYRDKRKSEEEAARLAATIQPAANANEHGTGYDAVVQYPFGYGLSYTSFAYSELKADARSVTLPVTNTGSRAGAEIVQVYAAKSDAQIFRPAQELKAFTKVWLEAGESKTVTLPLDDKASRDWNT